MRGRSDVYWPQSSAMLRHMREVQEACGTNSRAANRLKGELRDIVEQDNVEKLLGRGLLEGVDRYGQPLAPMAESTYKNPRRGLGPVLAPRGLLSRFITCFEVVWDGGVMLMRYANMLSKDGLPFAQYHLRGCPMGSKASQPNWSLPRRDVGGITPWGWSRFNAARSRWLADRVKRRGS